MARILDANLAFSGGEPKFTTELTKVEMMRTLNWYSQNKNSKDAEKWAQDYFKKKLKVDVGDALKHANDTFGYVCRIVSNGGQLDAQNKKWFENEIEDYRQSEKELDMMANGTKEQQKGVKMGDYDKKMKTPKASPTELKPEELKKLKTESLKKKKS